MKSKTLALLFLLAVTHLASAKLVAVKWDFDPNYRDVLEYQTELGGVWCEVEPPYLLSEEPDGMQDYLVFINAVEPAKFFRVARTHGVPLVLASPNASRSSAP